jgi:hypothetical protein
MPSPPSQGAGRFRVLVNNPFASTAYPSDLDDVRRAKRQPTALEQGLKPPLRRPDSQDGGWEEGLFHFRFDAIQGPATAAVLALASGFR